MTDVGNVNVTLGLNSEEFIKSFAEADDELKALEKRLKKSKQSFEEVSLAMAGADNPSKKLQNTYKKLKAELIQNQSAFDKFNNRLKNLDGGLTQSTDKVNKLNSAFGKIASTFTAGYLAKKVLDLGVAAVKTAGEFEQLAVSFEVLAGGAEQGKKLTDQIVELAAKTPLTTEALSDGARTLLSFGEASEEVINDLKLLGDITGGDTQRMQSLTLAFAQIGSTGKLAGQDLLQMINAGFNPLAIISEKTGKSMATLKDEMSKGLITFNDVKQAMIDATSEGGRFYGMMNKQSETLNGKISTLSDNWDILNKNIGNKFLPYIKTVVDRLISLASTIESPLNMQLNILDGTIKSITNAFKGIRDIIGHLIPGTNNLSNVFATFNANAAKLGLTLQYVLAPLEALQNGKTFADVGKKIQMLNAQWRGVDDAYFNALSGGKYQPLLNDLEKVNKAVKKNKEGFEALSAVGSSETGSKKKSTNTTQDKALEEYKKYIEQYQKLNNDYAATLKARQYVEGTLNIDPLAQADEYNKLISVYTSYFAKTTEISQSGAKNKGEILKLEERNLQQELQKIQVDKTRETQQKLYDIRKGYADEIEDIEIKQQAEGELGGFLGRYSTGYDERLQLLQWYYKERERITDMHNATMEEKQKAFDDLEQLNTIKAMEIQKNIWTQRGQEVTSIFNNTLDNMLTNYGDFSANMQQLVMNLSRYFIKEIMQSMITQLSGFGNIESNIGNVFNSIFNSANRMSNSFVNMASSATVAQGATQAMVATQAVLAPLSSTISSTTAASSANYAVAAQGALQLAAAVAQLAVSEAAYSVAKIPMIGGFLAPVAATLTAAAISAGTAMVATTSKGAGLLTKGKSFLGGGGSASTLSSGIGPIARADYSESLPKYHSGGLVPGTKEQLAVLKGGERVLNPAESTSYGGGADTGEGSVNNIMMFNIKAWDGKDVIKTLQANSQTINQIVSSGIKNNNQGLRTTVQNL